MLVAHLPLLVSLTTAAAACAAATAASAAAAVAAATAIACLLVASSSCSEAASNADTCPYEVAAFVVVVVDVVSLVCLKWWSFSLYDLTKLHLRFSLGGLGGVGVWEWECDESVFLRPRRPRNHFEALPIWSVRVKEKAKWVWAMRLVLRSHLQRERERERERQRKRKELELCSAYSESKCCCLFI